MEEIARAEALVEKLAPYLVHLAEACSVVVVLYGVARAVIEFFVNVAWTRPPDRPSTRIRLNLGRSLALALELLLAADILLTLLAPSTEAIVQLAVVAIIRTGLNFFLGREIEQAAREVDRDGESSRGQASSRRFVPAGVQPKPEEPLA